MKQFIFVLAALAISFPAHAVKNLSPVISGKLYISGNSGGRGPLGDRDLQELCNQGFTYAVYVYAGGVNKTVTCGGGRTLKYQNSTAWKNPAGLLAEAKRAIDGGGKALIHCWNGVHASRFAGAVALNQFCGFNGAETSRWWRAGFNAASLPAGAIAELQGRLSRLPSGRGGMSGCPSPR